MLTLRTFFNYERFDKD